MRKYEDVEREIVKKRTECVELRCDVCSRRAEWPNEGRPFPTDASGSGVGYVYMQTHIEEQWDSQACDLCHECAAWLIKQIRAGKIKRESKP